LVCDIHSFFFRATLNRDDFIFRFEGDVDEFLRQSAELHQGKVNIIHSPFDPVDIKVRGRRATSEALCLVSSSLTHDGVDYELTSHLRLTSRLENSPDTGKWYILSLEAVYVRDRLDTASPGSASSLSLTAEAQEYPRSYRNLAMGMLLRRLSPRPGLPNEDDQGSVRQVLDRNRAFLNHAE
jgi:hypothetical protein